jgi:hypothetical protein
VWLRTFVAQVPAHLFHEYKRAVVLS